MNPIFFFINHMAIKYLINKPKLSGKLAQRVLLLIKFYYVVEFKLGKKPLRVNHLSQISTELGIDDINDFLDNWVFTVQDVPTSYEHLIQFLSIEYYLEGLEKNENWKIHVNNIYFAIIIVRLYRRGIDGIFWCCISYDGVSSILEVCHGGAYEGHFSRHIISQKILWTWYCWPTLFANEEELIQEDVTLVKGTPAIIHDLTSFSIHPYPLLC